MSTAQSLANITSCSAPFDKVVRNLNLSKLLRVTTYLKTYVQDPHVLYDGVARHLHPL